MRDRRWTWSLVALAVLARAAAVLVLQSHAVPRSTFEHGEIAANLVTGRGFSIRFLGAEGPTSQQAPVYPLLVAAAYALGGVETPTSLLTLELGQALLGGILVAGVIRLAEEIAPGRPWVARAAGLLAAIHPTLVYAATHVQVALTAATLLTWTLVLALRAGSTRRHPDAVGTGVVLGLLTLTDPILALASVGVGWAILAGAGNLRDSARPLATVGLVAALVLLPWTIRNLAVHGELVAVKSTLGYAFWQGNCALSEGTDKVARASVERVLERAGSGLDLVQVNRALWAARHEAGYLDDIALTRSDYAELSQLTEPERSRRLFWRAIADLRAEPGRYPRLCLRRLRALVFFDETNPKTRNLVYRAGHLGLTGLALLGIVLAPVPIRRRLSPLLVTAALVAMFHALTIVSARFHIPLEPLMAVWAGCGLARFSRPPDDSGAGPHHVVRVGVRHRLGHDLAVAGGVTRPV